MNINATMFGQLISFAIFVWFCYRFVWPPLIDAIEARQKKIADGLADAQRAVKDLKLAKEKATDHLKDAKAEANKIVDQANKRKAQIIDEAKEQANREREKIIAQGKTEVEAERNRVQEELRAQLAELAVSGAEKILERSVDKDVSQSIVDKLVAELK
ncbi:MULTISPECIES: F0F1 ATP synthase subunit B [Aliagarivorans]|uniref:F0F1 ATP synthase subunit B n=1 Tax=Aliagarivorans TaxID=882379 RepID=UPI0004153107|nr:MULTISPECIES: F0F1 ATP synthase subunit B [Aliagarivorans]